MAFSDNITKALEKKGFYFVSQKGSHGKYRRIVSGKTLTVYVFVIEKMIDFEGRGADLVHEEIVSKLKPFALITNSFHDKYWKNKKQRAEKFGIEFIADQRKKDRNLPLKSSKFLSGNCSK